MFSKQEASALKQQFWTRFGQYMQPVPGAAGNKINWINYKTGIKDIYFKMDAANGSASIGIVMAQADPEHQKKFFNHLILMQHELHAVLHEPWQWHLHEQDAQGKILSRIYTSITGVSVLNKTNWPAIISFFKPRLMALDAFWAEAKDSLEML